MSDFNVEINLETSLTSDVGVEDLRKNLDEATKAYQKFQKDLKAQQKVGDIFIPGLNSMDPKRRQEFKKQLQESTAAVIEAEKKFKEVRRAAAKEQLSDAQAITKEIEGRGRELRIQLELERQRRAEAEGVRFSGTIGEDFKVLKAAGPVEGEIFPRLGEEAYLNLEQVNELLGKIPEKVKRAQLEEVQAVQRLAEVEERIANEKDANSKRSFMLLQEQKRLRSQINEADARAFYLQEDETELLKIQNELLKRQKVLLEPPSRRGLGLDQRLRVGDYSKIFGSDAERGGGSRLSASAPGGLSGVGGLSGAFANLSRLTRSTVGATAGVVAVARTINQAYQEIEQQVDAATEAILKQNEAMLAGQKPAEALAQFQERYAETQARAQIGVDDWLLSLGKSIPLLGEVVRFGETTAELWNQITDRSFDEMLQEFTEVEQAILRQPLFGSPEMRMAQLEGQIELLDAMALRFAEGSRAIMDADDALHEFQDTALDMPDLGMAMGGQVIDAPRFDPETGTMRESIDENLEYLLSIEGVRDSLVEQREAMEAAHVANMAALAAMGGPSGLIHMTRMHAGWEVERSAALEAVTQRMREGGDATGLIQEAVEDLRIPIAEVQSAVAAGEQEWRSWASEIRNAEGAVVGLYSGYEGLEAQIARTDEAQARFAGALASELEEQRRRIDGLLQIDFSVNTEDAIDDFEELTGNIQNQLDDFNAREAAAFELIPILGEDSAVIKALRAGQLDQFLKGEGLELSEILKLELQLDQVDQAKADALANTVEGSIDLATAALDQGEIRALGGVPGEFLIEGLEQAILDGEMNITSAILSVLRSAEAAALGPDGLIAESPSRKTYQWGEWMMEGLVEGIDENANAVADASVRVFATVEDALEGKPLFPVEIDAETQSLLDQIVAQRPEPGRDSTANFADFMSGLQEDIAAQAEAEAVRLKRSEAAERLREAGNVLFGELVAGGNADELLDDILLAPNQAVFDQIEDQLEIQGQTIGEAIVDGLVDGVESSEERLRNSLTKLGLSGIDALVSIYDIRSPSRVMYDIGVNIVEGLQLGITENTSLIDAAMTGLSPSVTSPISTSGSVGGSVDNSRTVNVYPATVGDDLILAKMILAGL